MKNTLGDRMKDYECTTRFTLPRRSYTIIRIDGKAFGTYTSGLNIPFDNGFMDDMDATAAYLCKNIMGADLAFVQSDEISIIITDFNKVSTGAWFDNTIQKMCSVSASMATNKFNQLRYSRFLKTNVGSILTPQFIGIIESLKTAEFDSRVFQIPQRVEVGNYLIWRQNDTTVNSISSVAQSLYSHSELMNKSCNVMQDMIFQKGINWNDFEAKYKRGRVIKKVDYMNGDSLRTKWVMEEPPIFSKDWEYLLSNIKDNIITNNEN
jgi:tRNA(His) guanylyltransferase